MSSRSSVRSCCACRRIAACALLLRLAGREARRRGCRSTSPGCRQPLSLNDVVCCYLGQRGRREEAYTRLRSIMREVQFAPPPALRQLAQITDFDLFVSTTFDPLLEQAINLERFGGEPLDRGHRLRAEPRRRPARRTQPAAATGRLSPARPAVGLADLRDLRRGHARVHLRAAVRAPDAREAVPRARAQPPAADRQRFLELAGAAVPAHGQAPAPVRSARRRRGHRRRPHQQDDRLVTFLQQVSVRTRVYGGAEAFVAELHARWTQRRGTGARARPAA